MRLLAGYCGPSGRQSVDGVLLGRCASLSGPWNLTYRSASLDVHKVGPPVSMHVPHLSGKELGHLETHAHITIFCIHPPKKCYMYTCPIALKKGMQ